jgi:hypothetical protein
MTSATNEKLDFKVLYKKLYAARRGVFSEVVVPALRYLAIDGQGDPATSPSYVAAIEALYNVSYTLKFMSKQRGRDYVVGPLEGLWWADDMDSFVEGRRDQWRWTMMNILPEWIDASTLHAAKVLAQSKEPGRDLSGVGVLDLTEGRSVQTLFVGPYCDEAPVIAELHQVYLAERGLRACGKHHEIYLGDPRRTEPGKLRTILRQPVE